MHSRTYLWALGAVPAESTVCDIHKGFARFEAKEVSVRGSIDVCTHRGVNAFEKGLHQYGMRATATIAGTSHAKAPVHPYAMPAIDVRFVQRAVFEVK